jgi:hypothetical protein
LAIYVTTERQPEERRLGETGGAPAGAECGRAGRDPIISVEHASAAHRLVPASRLELFPDAGHVPHLDDPLRFARC